MISTLEISQFRGLEHVRFALGDPLRFLRLDRRVDDPAKIVATTFGKEEMQTAIEFNREMR